MQTVNLEVKGNVAKLLATENLMVEHKNVQTASFDVDKRVLTLPNWKKASNSTFDLLVAHEVGHALYTPAGEWDEKAPHDFINVCEDPRIEKLMKRKYAGLNKIFYNGYSELDQQDFFEVDSIDLEEMNLADRINLHFKVGSFREIPFEEKEFPIVEMVEDAETFDDVLNAAEALYKYCKQKKKEENEEEKANAGLDAPDSSGSGEGSSHPFFDEEDGEGEGEGEQDQPQEGGDSGSSQMQPTDQELLDELFGEGGKEGSDEPEVETQKALDSHLQNLSNQDSYENSYVEIPKLKYEDIVHTHDKVQKDLNDHFASYEDECDQFALRQDERVPILSYPDNALREFVRSSSKEVNYLVKEFEMKKSADAYARAATSKTGVLDTRNLHTYKFNDDIFKKITTLPDGKNHGLVFVLDWSGSMSTCIHDTVKQLINLVSFCRKVKIPFEVYAFVNHFYENSDGYGYYSSGKDEWLHERKEGLLVIDSPFRLLNLISSSAGKKDIDNQIKNLWRMSYSYQVRGSLTVPPIYSLGGTPLNEAVISLHCVLPHFKKVHDLQKVHAIILTDGEAAGICKSRKYDKDYSSYHTDGIGRTSLDWNTYLRNRKTGRTYAMSGQFNTTVALLEDLGDTFPDINLIGIRLCSNREFGQTMRGYVEYEERDRKHREWRKNGSVTLKGKGYDRLFAISCNSLDNDVEFEVKEDATKAQIRQAFKKTLKSKSMNKKILSEFVDLVA